MIAVNATATRLVPTATGTGILSSRNRGARSDQSWGVADKSVTPGRSGRLNTHLPTFRVDFELLPLEQHRTPVSH